METTNATTSIELTAKQVETLMLIESEGNKLVKQLDLLKAQMSHTLELILDAKGYDIKNMMFNVSVDYENKVINIIENNDNNGDS
jgi:hypothetical protein